MELLLNNLLEVWEVSVSMPRPAPILIVIRLIIHVSLKSPFKKF